ncbi:MAG: hypothetical protein AB7N54_10290 [Alphaproteobacteria bacterium]
MAKKPSGKKAAGAKAGQKSKAAKKAPARARATRPTQDASTDILGGEMKSLIAGAFLRRGG